MGAPGAGGETRRKAAAHPPPAAARMVGGPLLRGSAPLASSLDRGSGSEPRHGGRRDGGGCLRGSAGDGSLQPMPREPAGPIGLPDPSSLPGTANSNPGRAAYGCVLRSFIKWIRLLQNLMKLLPNNIMV